MKGHFSVKAPVLLLAALTLMLLWDRTGFIRLSIICALLHESGHIVSFFVLTGRMPRVSCSFSGLQIEMDGEHLSSAKENLLLISGPLANLLAAGVAGLLILSHASFGRYFFVCENLCLAVFNLLPIGFLDGGRLAANLLGAERVRFLHRLSALSGLAFAGFGFWLFFRQGASFFFLLFFCLLTFALILKNMKE